MNGHNHLIWFGFDSMMILMSTLLLCISETVAGFGLLLLPFLVIPSCLLCFEKRIPALLINYLLPSCIVLMLPFPHYAWLAFTAVIGWYAPIRALVSRLRNELLGNILSFLMGNVGIAIALILLSLIEVFPFSGLDPFWLVLLIIGVELDLLLLDLIYQFFSMFYPNTLKALLLK